jgi:hypothetical protein
MNRTPVKRDLSYRLHTTATTLTVICAWWDMWWLFAESESRKQHIEPINNFPNLFRLNAEAHLRSVLISTYSLYDPRSITLRSLQTEAMPEGAEAARIGRMLHHGEALAEKLKPFRHKLIAHRSPHATIQEIYAEARLTPNQIKRLITISCTAFNAIARAARAPQFLRTHFAREEMLQMLKELKNN